MLDLLQYYFRVLCNGMKMRFRMVMIAHPGPGIGFHKRFMWQIIIPPTTGLLQTICTNNLPFRWSPLHQKCFDQIKVIVCKTPILKPICWNVLSDTTEEEKLNYRVWVITDACPARVGAVLAQGADWKTSRPASFMSKKFTTTQHGYFRYELGALGILKALTKWLDELTGGHKFTVVTDHKALTYFKAKQHTTGHCHNPCRVVSHVTPVTLP